MNIMNIGILTNTLTNIPMDIPTNILIVIPNGIMPSQSKLYLQVCYL